MRVTILVFTILFVGCATSTAYISSLTDPGYQPKKSDPIFIFVPDTTPIKDRQFASFIESEMEDAGFNLVQNISDSRYILLFNTGTKTSEINSTLFLPQTQTTSGYVGNTYYSGQTTSTAAIPVSSNYTVQKIWFQLYSTTDVASKKYKTVWEGYIGSGIDEYRRKPREILRLLLDVFGTNYQEHTRIRSIPENE